MQKLFLSLTITFVFFSLSSSLIIGSESSGEKYINGKWFNGQSFDKKEMYEGIQEKLCGDTFGPDTRGMTCAQAILEVENRIKAGQFHNIKRDMPYYQARFLKRLAEKLGNMGYGIRKTKSAFELTLVPQEAIDHFSKRTNHIGQVAKDNNITHPKALDKLGAITRRKKDNS